MAKTMTKRALLTSVFSLLLCFVMLIGTTFAWFTDTVTSTGNIITSGKLDVEMYWADGTLAVPTTDAGWTDASTGAIFNYDKWEPGYAEVRHIKIANVGTLALKYQVAITANDAVSDLADVIDVYYVDPANQVTSRAELTDDKKLGTLTQVLAGMATSASGELIANEAHTLTLALKMQESAGNEYQNKSIGTDFSVKVVATQLDYEGDSFDSEYDVSATLPSVGVATVKPNSSATTIEAGNVSVTVPAGVDAGEYKVVVTNEKSTTDTNGQTTYNADINLLKDGVKVEGNGSTVYFVKIEVEAGQNIIKVLHNGNEVTEYEYNAETGILGFETDSFSPFTVIYEENKTVKVSSSEEFMSAMAAAESGAVIDATDVTLEPTGSLDTTVRIPAGVTVKGAKFTSGSQCYLVVDGVGEDVKFESCEFAGPGFGMFVIAGEDQDGANMVFESCILKGQIAPNFVQNSAGKSTFNNCTFTVGSDNIGLVNCMGGEHTFNNCTFDYTGGATFGSNQYVKWNAVNSYSESYSTKVVLVGCTYKNCGTQRFGSNSTLTIK